MAPKTFEEFKNLFEQPAEFAADLPAPVKGDNGPRFADVNVAVEHMPGTFEAARVTARPKAKTAKRTAPLGPAEALLILPEMRERVVAWTIEREAIRQRKASGQPWPWSTDQILNAGHFCNVHREHDYGSHCVRVKLLEPFRDQVDLWFAVTAVRCINEPAAWIELGTVVPFDPEHCRKVFEAREARGETNFRNAAYKVPTPPTKGDSTIRFLFEDVLTPLWHDRESLRPQSGETLLVYSDRLRERYRIGPFLAGQIIADLKHVPPLESAPDWSDFAVPGPGSERGLNRVCGRPLNASWSEAQWLATLLQLRDEIASQLEAAGIAPLDAQNMQNVLCEFDKYERAREKDGVPSRKYKPSVPTTTENKRTRKTKSKTRDAFPTEAGASTGIAPADAPAAQPINGTMAAIEAADGAQITVTTSTAAADETKELLDFIAQEQAAEQARAETKPAAYQIDLAEASLPPALTPLTAQPRWVNWRWEWRDNKWAKPPIQPGNGHYARNNDPSTWGTYAEAVKRAADGGADGIGFCLLGCEIGAIDLDDCRDRATGVIADWAQAIIDRAPEDSYCEITVSGEGLRLIGLGKGDELHYKFKAPDGKGSFELYRKCARYITVSGKAIRGADGPLVSIDDLLDQLLAEAGQRTASATASTTLAKLTGKWARGGMTVPLYESIAADAEQGGRAGKFLIAVAQLKRFGWSVDGIIWLLEKHLNGIAGKYADRLPKEVKRAFDKVTIDGPCLGDFFAYMPLHQYYYAPARRLWPAASVNSRFPSVALLDDEGHLVVSEGNKPKPIVIPAAMWLDRNRPVEEMTWSPGDPMLVHDRLMVENVGWISKLGDTTFNLYLPPIIQPGDPRQALRWIKLICKLFGKKSARHIINYLAHRVQRPQEKIQHGLVLGGAPGIGKDTLLAPVRYAVGPWNFREASPKDMMGTFNPYAKAVILRVNEVRDLGSEVSQYAFYEHMKLYLASSDQTLPVNEKYIKHYNVPNVCGVVYTTNYLENGLYLPEDDRRHFVAWSERTAADFTPEFWSKLWDWYHDGGFWHVTAYLPQRDISGFRPGEPPEKTEAFWNIANANRSTDETGLDGVLERMGRPAAITVERIITAPNVPFDLVERLQKSPRLVPKHLRDCGYIPVHNPDAPGDRGRWYIGPANRQPIYARKDLSLQQRLAAARKLAMGS
jgi:hypothetical protein